MRNARSAVACIGFGLLTWSVAHLTTLTAFAHIHPGYVVHYHSAFGPLAVAAMMLTLTSLAGAGSSLLGAPRSTARASLATGALAPAVFVGVEFLEYLTGQHEAPPTALLLIGCLVHAAIGAAAPTLWAVCAGGVHVSGVVFTPARALASAAVRTAVRTFVVTDDERHRPSRAPPARGSLLPSAC